MSSVTQLHHQGVPELLKLDQHQVPLVVRRNRRSKRIYLRYNPADHIFALTLPQSTMVSEGVDFIHTKAEWIADILNHMPLKKHIKPGVVVPILGQKHRVRYVDKLRGSFALRHGELLVSGPREMLPRRIEDGLKKIIRNELYDLACYKASLIGRSINRVTLRDTSSRWGSCSSDRNLMFSWRLVFAPYEVIDYVVSHEVAHLRHMNHSQNFWNTVEMLSPDYESWKDWLKYHGKELYRYHI